MFRAICRSIKKRKSILNFTNEELVGCTAIANDSQVTKICNTFQVEAFIHCSITRFSNEFYVKFFITLNIHPFHENLILEAGKIIKLIRF